MKKIIPFLLICFIISSSNALFAGYHENGRKYYIYKKYDKAKEMFLKSIESSDYGNSYYFLGEIEKNQKNYTEAEKYFKACIEKNTTKKYIKNAYWNLIVLAEGRGDLNETVRLCRELWKKIKNSGGKSKVESLINRYLWTDNTEAIAVYKQAVSLKKKGNTELSLKKFNEAMNISSTFLAPRFETGMIEYQKGNYNSAAGYLQDVVSGIPFYAEAHLVLGDIYYNNRYFQRASDHFQKALTLGFNSKKTRYMINLKLGTCYFKNNDFENAELRIEEAITLRKKTVKPLLLLSAIRIKQKKYDEALSTLLKAKLLKKNNPMILFQIGSIYYRKDDWRFISYFDRLYDLSVKNGTTAQKKYRKIFIILLKEHFKKGNYRRTEEIIASLPDTDNTYEIIIIKAKTRYHNNDFDGAIDIFEKISLSDEDRFLLCKSYFRSGKKEKSKQILSSLSPESDFYMKAAKDRHLSSVINSIEEEKKKLEETKRREEEKRIEEEKKLEELRKKQREEELQKKLRDEKTAKNIQSEINSNENPLNEPENKKMVKDEKGRQGNTQ